MIQPVTAAAAPPIAYSGGTPSTAKPSFGASLQATLAQLQATNQGITAAQHHHNPTASAKSTNPFGAGAFSAAAPFAASSAAAPTA